MNAVEVAGQPQSKADRLVRLSWWMLPLLVVSLVAAAIVGMILLFGAGLEGSEPLSEQGAIGWLALILANLVILPLPAYVGLWFGVKARRTGAAAKATMPIVAHSVVIAAVWLFTIVAMLKG
jgi:hypothetical protein